MKLSHDVFDDKWPPFTSSVTFELFRKRTPASKQDNFSGLRALSSVWRRPDEHSHRLSQKENFNIKLRVHFLEERLAQSAPDQIDAALKQNINLKIEEHDRVVDVVEDEWRGEVEEARSPCRTRERSKGTRLNITELKANTNDLHAKFEVTLAHLEQEAEEKDSELRAANEIEHLEKQPREEDAVEPERETLEALASALKDKVSGLKSQLQDPQELYDQSLQNMYAHRACQEELAGHIEDLVTEVKRREQEARESLQHEFDSIEKTHKSEL
ncbi:hypothetical protein P692DRAFT_20821421 [Suillus brevipes Sb2]|nr:hypothetical protein P692DRAFT_20821421 [Suillus brevipes Sb2]